MNILYTITSYPPSMGGAQLYAHEIAKRMSIDHKVKVACFFDTNRTDWLLGTTLKASSSERTYNYEGIEVKQIHFNKKEKLRIFPGVCTYYMNKTLNMQVISGLIESKLKDSAFKPDLIHNIRVGREPLSYASFSLAKNMGIPFVFTPLHHSRWSHPFFKEYHRLYRQANGLIALTEHEKRVYKDLGVKDNNIFVTGMGTVLSPQSNPQRFKEKYNLTGNIILFIGQGYKYKGISELFKAASIIFESRQDVDFIFIGPQTQYSSRLFRNNHDKRIKHLGKVDLQTKTDALSACDIFCLPSRQESFGAVFLEAWSFQKPVIGLNIPQLRCFIEDGINGYLVTPDPKIIAQRVINLLESIDLRKKFGKAGKKLMEKKFTWNVLYSKTVAAYEQVLECFKNKKHE